jgi:hypothetical protein
LPRTARGRADRAGPRGRPGGRQREGGEPDPEPAFVRSPPGRPRSWRQRAPCGGLSLTGAGPCWHPPDPEPGVAKGLLTAQDRASGRRSRHDGRDSGNGEPESRGTGSRGMGSLGTGRFGLSERTGEDFFFEATYFRVWQHPDGGAHGGAGAGSPSRPLFPLPGRWPDARAGCRLSLPEAVALRQDPLLRRGPLEPPPLLAGHPALPGLLGHAVLPRIQRSGRPDGPTLWKVLSSRTFGRVRTARLSGGS